MPRLTIATALAVMAAPVLAGRPLVTETADALERGDCEIEAAWARATVRDGRTAHGGEGILPCGIGGSAQLGGGSARELSLETKIAF